MRVVPIERFDVRLMDNRRLEHLSGYVPRSSKTRFRRCRLVPEARAQVTALSIDSRYALPERGIDPGSE